MPTFKQELVLFLRKNEFSPQEHDLPQRAEDIHGLFGITVREAVEVALASIELSWIITTLIQDKEHGFKLHQKEVVKLTSRQYELYRWLHEEFKDWTPAEKEENRYRQPNARCRSSEPQEEDCLAFEGLAIW